MDGSVIMYRNRLNQPINKFCVRCYLLLSIPIFLINTEIVPSMLVINSTWSGFLYSSIGIVISMPVSVYSFCFWNFLLSITKIVDGSVKLHLSDQVVDDIISEALRHIDRRAAEHHIAVDCGDVLLLARMDAGLIMQVLINLVNNAVKYTPVGSNIRITAIPRENMAEICVSDNGPGIPNELKERVFEMFFTGGNPIGDSRRSLGLGLTLCQTIVHAHHGEMTLKDNSPHGCIFSFTIPLSEVNLNE